MPAAAVSLAPARVGEAVIDAQTPVHFLVGFIAGVLKIDPHVAVLTFIGAKVIDQALRAGAGHALFEREHGQSLGNELSDLLFEMAGLTVGEKLRDKLEEPAPTAGLGRLHFRPYMGLNLTLIPNGAHP